MPTARNSPPKKKDNVAAIAGSMRHLAQARKSLASDYLCPDERCWARLNVAVAHAREVDPETYPKQESLAYEAGIAPTALSRALKPVGENEGVDADLLKVLAGLMDVDAGWLLQGFTEDGLDHWPPWTADLIAAGRGTLESIFMDYLDGHIAEKPTPPVILKIVYGCPPIFPAPAEVNFPDHVGQGAALMGEVRNCIARHRISPDTYLSRYIPALTKAWQDELANQRPSTPSKKRLFRIPCG